VGVETADPSSVLNFYRRLLALRRSHPALRDGAYVPLLRDDPNVLAFLRRTQDAAVLVALNMSASLPTLGDVLAGHGLEATTGRVLAGTMHAENKVLPLGAITLRPFEVLIADVGGSAAAPKRQ
jgi:alpha-glucosidase